MAIGLLKAPEIFTSCGLSMINPITVVANRTASEEYAVCEVYQITDFNTNLPVATLKATLSSVFDPIQNVAYFELSEVLKGLFKPVQDLGVLRDTPYGLANTSLPQIEKVFCDDRYKVVKYKVIVSGNEFVGYCYYANKVSYNRYYTGFPNVVPNNQVTFKNHVITADDVDIPTYFGRDYNEQDYNIVDYK